MFKSPTELVLLLLVVIFATYAYTKSQEKSVAAAAAPAQPIVMMMPPAAPPRGGDDRYTRAPRPQRMWDNGPEIPIRGALDPIATRGAPESYQQMGILTAHDGKLLPLYGRRVAPRSDYFNYYTRTDTYNPVAVPVRLGRRDCQDSTGCSEVFNGDKVQMTPTGESATVTLYGFDGPRYVSDVI
jgi:hypothetical protein